MTSIASPDFTGIPATMIAETQRRASVGYYQANLRRGQIGGPGDPTGWYLAEAGRMQEEAAYCSRVAREMAGVDTHLWWCKGADGFLYC